MPKFCMYCGVNKATVPDRNRMGRPINRVCTSCHGKLLMGDWAEILRLQAERRKELEERNDDVQETLPDCD